MVSSGTPAHCCLSCTCIQQLTLGTIGLQSPGTCTPVPGLYQSKRGCVSLSETLLLSPLLMSVSRQGPCPWLGGNTHALRSRFLSSPPQEALVQPYVTATCPTRSSGLTSLLPTRVVGEPKFHPCDCVTRSICCWLPAREGGWDSISLHRAEFNYSIREPIEWLTDSPAFT